MIYKLSRCIAPNSDVLEDGYGMYFENFGELPDEVVLCILSFLNRKTIITKIELVNHRFNRLARNEFLWWNITFHKRGRSPQVLDSQVRLFDNVYAPQMSATDHLGIKFKLNCRDYYMEKVLVKRSCDSTTNRMFSPQTPSTPGGDSSPTTLKKKLRMSWRPSLLNTETTPLFIHDRNFEKRMKLCQEANKEGHVNPHARHRHTITCTTPDESSFVMVGGFKNANHAAAAANAANPEETMDDTDVVHEFCTKAAHFKQIKIKKGDGSPMTPTPSTPGSPFSPFSIAQYQQSFGHLRTDSWGSTSSAANSPTPRTPGHARTVSFGSSKPLQFGKHSCVCVDNRRLFLFGGTEGENTTVTNNLYIYDLETKDWMKQEYAPDELQPTPRTNHQAALVTNSDGRQEMYIVGGGIGQQMTPTDEIWALDIETMLWRKVEVKLKPDQKTCPFTPRLGFTMSEVNNKLIVYGGGYWHQSGNDKRWKEYYRELFVFDVKSSVWSNIDMGHCIDEVPRSGTFPVSCRVGAHLFVVGGGIVWDVSAEVNVLDLVTFKWRKLHSEQAYAADSSACISIKDYSENLDNPKTKILLFGGYRYKPLNEYKVFAVKWKDFMTERGMSSVVPNAPDLGAINTSS